MRRILFCLVLFSSAIPCQKTDSKLPPVRKQANVRAVVKEHLDALNACDWSRLVAQFPDNVEIFLPGGTDVIGRQKVADLFRNVVKPASEGGVCGLKFEEVHSDLVGDTLSMHWKITGDALAEPYHGTDAYITKDGLMAAQVTTFVRNDLKMKK